MRADPPAAALPEPSPLPRADVAIQSFRKPESLVYTLLTLHAHCAPRIGAVWINDDRSEDGSVEAVERLRASGRLAPWDVRLRVNRRRVAFRGTIMTPGMIGRAVRGGTTRNGLLRMAHGLATRGLFRAEDVRYQNALGATAAPYVIVLHDDVRVTGDLATLLIETMEADPRLAIAGPLGQCWRCGHAPGCTPRQVLEGRHPSPQWPRTRRPGQDDRARYDDRACRVNEWCCILRVSAARELARDHVFFGNKEAGGDTAAYWFAEAVRRGWRFADPFPVPGRHRFFKHGWQGHAGNDVWKPRGQGGRDYARRKVRKRLRAEFGYSWPAEA